MPWESLQKRLDNGDLPLVLTGPMLRKVTPDAVTVWFALKESVSEVYLEVLNEEGTRVMEGKRPTIAIGENLHVVAVTANIVVPFVELKEGIVYRYNVEFRFDGERKQTLAKATNEVRLAYSPYKLPSFCLPPADLNKLRLIQGSCRLPHGEGKDALPILDNLIAQTAESAMERPHQLLLTGDQIYADDVSDALLVMLLDATDVLLHWQEEIVPDSAGGPMGPSPIPACLRASVLRRLNAGLPWNHLGFTSTDLQSHLMSLGEYLAMYLFVWSDVLWPAVLPSFQNVADQVYTRIPSETVWAWKPTVNLDPGRIGIHSQSVAEFSKTLLNVRRALANIPSYMIFDDHEVTDDWNMTRDFCRGIYGSELGLRIVQNALVAYALCQHWGNAPEQFEQSNPKLPGTALLQLLDKGTAATYEANSPKILNLIGVHKIDKLDASSDYNLAHEANSLTYHYTIEGPKHHVIITDTRTWRSFKKGEEAPHLLSESQLKTQIYDARPESGEKALLVVLSTNAPPIQPIRTATRYGWLSNAFEHFPDIYEAWECPSIAFDRLLVTLTQMLPEVSILPGFPRVRYGSVILLSGDVHHSFASRLQYKASSRFEDQGPTPAMAVIAQLVASSLRKQTQSTIDLHRHGYDFAPWYGKPLVPEHIPEGYVGWNLRTGSQEVGKSSLDGAPPHQEYITINKLPTIPIKGTSVPKGTEFWLTRVPAYRYRLDYLVGSNDGVVPSPTPSIPPIPGASVARDLLKTSAKTFHMAFGILRSNKVTAKPKQKIVGRNNIGEITFAWNSTKDNKVYHILRWWDPKRKSESRTTYEVSLNPMDTQFADFKADRGDP